MTRMTGSACPSPQVAGKQMDPFWQSALMKRPCAWVGSSCTQLQPPQSLCLFTAARGFSCCLAFAFRAFQAGKAGGLAPEGWEPKSTDTPSVLQGNHQSAFLPRTHYLPLSIHWGSPACASMVPFQKAEAMTDIFAGICSLSGLYPRARAWQVQVSCHPCLCKPSQHCNRAMALYSSLGQLSAGDVLENTLAVLTHQFSFFPCSLTARDEPGWALALSHKVSRGSNILQEILSNFHHKFTTLQLQAVATLTMLPVLVPSHDQRKMRDEERTVLCERLIFRAVAHQERSRESAEHGSVCTAVPAQRWLKPRENLFTLVFWGPKFSRNSSVVSVPQLQPHFPTWFVSLNPYCCRMFCFLDPIYSAQVAGEDLW